MINTEKSIEKRLKPMLKYDPRIHGQVKGNSTKNLIYRPKPNFPNTQQN